MSCTALSDLPCFSIAMLDDESWQEQTFIAGGKYSVLGDN